MGLEKTESLRSGSAFWSRTGGWVKGMNSFVQFVSDTREMRRGWVSGWVMKRTSLTASIWSSRRGADQNPVVLSLAVGEVEVRMAMVSATVPFSR